MRVFHLSWRPVARTALLGSALLAVPALAMACGGDDDDATPTKAASGGASGGSASGAPVTIAMTDNVFTAKEIKVPLNTAVKITVENKGSAVHNMHVQSKDKEGKDFTSEALVNPGANSTFEVKFAKKGTYNFVCDYHLPAMAGTITVE